MECFYLAAFAPHAHEKSPIQTQLLPLLLLLLLQFFEYSSDGEIRYNTREPAGCIVGDNISTYLSVQLCRKRGQPVPIDQKFVFRKVRRGLKMAAMNK